MWTRIPSSSLRVTGADRLDFIHGQMTGDLRGAPTPGLVPCVFLNVKGQIEQFARVYRRADDVYVHLAADQAGELAARLRRYIIFDQVEVSDLTATLATLNVWHEADLPGWQVDGPDAQQFDLAGCPVLGGRVKRSAQVGVDLHYLQQHAAAVEAALGQPETPLAELEAARIAAGLPDVERDQFQGTLLQEIGLDVGGPLPAISYRKGCYVGQEIMARLEARGNTRYHLVRLRGEGLKPHTEVRSQGQVLGRAGAVAGGLSLARLRKEVQPGSAVWVGEQPATVEFLNTHA